MNRMHFEAIKHEAAREVFGEEWVNQLDNTEQYERKIRNWTDEAKMKEYWLEIFSDMKIANEYYDEV